LNKCRDFVMLREKWGILKKVGCPVHPKHTQDRATG
jgi:hypothetical protein